VTDHNKEQAERRRILREATTMFEQAQAANVPSGRMCETPQIVGSAPIIAYPPGALPCDPVPAEPPLGISVSAPVDIERKE
jgi:hypothetical protein